MANLSPTGQHLSPPQAVPAAWSPYAWQCFVENEQPAPALEADAEAATRLSRSLGVRLRLTDRGVAVSGEREQTRTVAAHAARTLLRQQEIPAALSLWWDIPAGTTAAEVVPGIAEHLGRPRPRGENVCTWTTHVIAEQRLRLVVLANLEGALHGKGIKNLRGGELPYLFKTLPHTLFLLVGTGLEHDLLTGPGADWLGHYVQFMTLAPRDAADRESGRSRLQPEPFAEDAAQDG
ncbi:hypothetical protein ABZ897_42910 [Nonomuraea sp. NPDC046802]|uniref:hypothetical protein n=1 Tax=Nonomuraea sp. NPDC046802 TaxID=3154919 RepID=UPI0033CD35AC